MTIVQKEINGELKDFCVYGKKIRLYCDAAFFPLDKMRIPQAPSNRFDISACQDGSFEVRMLKLVPSFLSSEELQEQGDQMINEMESALYIPDGYLSSSSWWAGHENDDYDHLLSVKDLEYLNSHRE